MLYEHAKEVSAAWGSRFERQMPKLSCSIRKYHSLLCHHWLLRYSSFSYVPAAMSKPKMMGSRCSDSSQHILETPFHPGTSRHSRQASNTLRNSSQISCYVSNWKFAGAGGEDSGPIGKSSKKSILILTISRQY